MLLTWAYGAILFTVERSAMKKLRLQSRAIPRYSFRLCSLKINAICEADRKGAKVVSLGLLNQAQMEPDSTSWCLLSGALHRARRLCRECLLDLVGGRQPEARFAEAPSPASACS